MRAFCILYFLYFLLFRVLRLKEEWVYRGQYLCVGCEREVSFDLFIRYVAFTFLAPGLGGQFIVTWAGFWVKGPGKEGGGVKREAVYNWLRRLVG